MYVPKDMIAYRAVRGELMTGMGEDEKCTLFRRSLREVTVA